MSSCLAEPVICGSFWKNRGGEVLRVELRSFEGQTVIDIRIWRHNRDGKMLPRKSGVCCSVRKLPDLIGALMTAQRKLEELQV
jgi:Transcriptional Coactivator p15 (PC4)